MGKPPITIKCDCGASASVPYGERWHCDACGRTWDTTQIPAEEYTTLLRSMRRYKLLTVGPPLLAAAVLIPLMVKVGIQFGILLFVAVLLWRLYAVPGLRRRASRRVIEGNPKWMLRADQP
ncbi:MAG: hypothetical protein ABI927_04320 [Gaiellaceae bacterium]